MIWSKSCVPTMQWELVSAFDAVVQPRDRGLRLHKIRPTNKIVKESTDAVPEHFGRFSQAQMGARLLSRISRARRRSSRFHSLEPLAESLLLHVEVACLQKCRRRVRS